MLPEVSGRYGARVRGGFCRRPGGGQHLGRGPPEKSVWYGTNVPQAKSIPIGTFRCASCGYLESYARPEFERQ